MDAKKRFELQLPLWTESLSPAAKDFLEHLLEVDPALRYTADMALAHPWLKSKSSSEQRLDEIYLQSPSLLAAAAEHNRAQGGRSKDVQSRLDAARKENEKVN